MTPPSLLMCALPLLLLLGPKNPKEAPADPPPGTTIGPKASPKQDPATQAPATPPASKGKGKGKGKGGPSQEGLATPPAGLRFVYVTPSDLVGANEDWVIRSDGGLGVRQPSNAYQFTAGSVQVRLPDGARLRWLDCTISGTSTRRNSFALHARLARFRYDEQPYNATANRLLGQFELTNTRAMTATEQGAAFGAGVAVPASADSVTSDDGWFTLQIFLRDEEAFAMSFHACRIGYEP